MRLSYSMSPLELITILKALSCVAHFMTAFQSLAIQCYRSCHCHIWIVMARWYQRCLNRVWAWRLSGTALRLIFCRFRGNEAADRLTKVSAELVVGSIHVDLPSSLMHHLIQKILHSWQQQSRKNRCRAEESSVILSKFSKRCALGVSNTQVSN